MKISSDQYAALAQVEDDAFADRLANSLRQTRAEAAEADPEELAAMVRVQIARAEAHGFRTEWQIAVYVTAASALGGDFDTRVEEIRAALAQEGLALDARARIIVEHLGSLTTTAGGTVSHG